MPQNKHSGWSQMASHTLGLGTLPSGTLAPDGCKKPTQLYFLLEIILYSCRRETTGQAKQRHFLSFLF